MRNTEPAAARTTSLATRLGVALVLLLALGGAAVAIAALAYGRSAARQTFDRLLVGAADQIAASIALRDGTVVVDLPASAFDLLALAPDDRIVYSVVAPDGAVVTGYDIAAPPNDLAELYDGAFTGEPARFAVARRRFAERDFAGTVDVVVGQTTRARAELAGQITRNALVVVLGAGLLMSALAVFAVRSALSPLRRIERVFAARSPRDLTPLGVPVPREISGLVGTLNRFMGRIDRQVETMRTLIADASHQIRTPIAALRAQADAAADETDPERQRAIVARIHERSINLGRLTDQLLNHAMIIHRADTEALDRLDLRTVAIRTTEETDHDFGASETVLRLDLPEDPVWCDGDALSLVEACKNLVANAFRHGVPPVTIAVGEEADCVHVAVRDRGPGVPEEHWSDAQVRYRRQTGVSSTSAGLGLAIVHAVARAHRGDLRFRRPVQGGFEAAVVLPSVGGAR